MLYQANYFLRNRANQRHLHPYSLFSNKVKGSVLWLLGRISKTASNDWQDCFSCSTLKVTHVFLTF